MNKYYCLGLNYQGKNGDIDVGCSRSAYKILIVCAY